MYKDLAITATAKDGIALDSDEPKYRQNALNKVRA